MRTSSRRIRSTPGFTLIELYDVPASYHGGAGALNFADGHSETHRWIDPRTKPKLTPNSTAQHLTTPNNPDMIWLQRHSSAVR